RVSRMQLVTWVSLFFASNILIVMVADGGTLFLDEVVDLHPEIQAKLLRVLEEKEFFPVGGTRTRKVDIRIVSACNKDLWQVSESGQFRKDLFFRLATIRIELPSLRQRSEDIVPLAMAFMEVFNDKYGKRFRDLSPEARQLLLSYQWPGNVRELRNAIERVVLLENDETILGRHLSFMVGEAAGGSTSTNPSGDMLRIELPQDGVSFEEVEKEIILQAYDRCGKNKSKTARFLRMPRHILTYRMKKYGLED
ncbi:MAG: sigma 54-interacting transcriptional regulator, partial [Acidobacteriota bacterium]